MVFLEVSQNSQENTCVKRLFFNKVAGLAFKNLKGYDLFKGWVCNFIKKKSLAQVFCCEFCEISKNTFFYRTSPVAASALRSVSEVAG